ncbi:PAAR-like domain-containing protein [Neorhizobium alkalisoli]|uniref:PAAR-like domain-containing protein n=1 Tax=Neorhizobium alkalisoli TaxID=528178 RepID=UPI0024782033|nr:PAAR-like domain-containing protein [Neorhizobium alkalisoli]
MHCTGPDVCWTPMGSSMVKVPYLSMVTLGASVRTSRTVRNNGKQDFQLNSRALVVTGHEPGVGRGVKVNGYKSHALAKKGSKTVFSEGWAVVRDSNPAWINRPGPGGTEPHRSMSEKEVPILLAGSGGTPGNNQAQNKQINALVKQFGLTKDQRQQLHQIISGQNLGYQEIKQIIIDEFWQ